MNPTSLVLVKHALPVLDATKPAKEWRLGDEGERQSRRLAGRLRAFAPLHLVASPEPKASRTAELVGVELGVRVASIDGLREFDRPVLPYLSKPEHERANAQIFIDLNRRVLGAESGQEALDRFSAAIETARTNTDAQTLVAITHGTVIALFVADHNDVDAFDLWKRLQCTSFVVLALPAFSLREVVIDAADARAVPPTPRAP
jgi:broad specificity phosphatase PhoE